MFVNPGSAANDIHLSRSAPTGGVRFNQAKAESLALTEPTLNSPSREEFNAKLESIEVRMDA